MDAVQAEISYNTLRFYILTWSRLCHMYQLLEFTVFPKTFISK